MSAKSNATAWIIFLISLLVLSLAATPYWRAADQLLIAVRLSLVLAASVIFVRARWRRRGNAAPPADHAESFLLRLRRWYHGE